MPISLLKLLLVEDSPHDAELTLLILESSGLNVDATLVYNHKDVERELSGGRFDLILSDYLLPGSSGPDVLATALRLAPKTPFIFLSGIFGEQHAVEMMRMGAVDYVLKQNLRMLPKAVTRAVLEVQEREKRQRAEQTLKETEIRAHLAIEAAEMGVWTYDPRSETLLWDERCKALYGVPADAQVSFSFMFSRCHPEDREALRSKVLAALSGDTGFQIEHRILTEGEDERWVFSNGRSLFENGQCVRFTGVMQDISERKQATEALQQLNDILNERVVQRTRERDRTWELSRELLGVLRLDLTPIALNPAWEATLGWTRNDFQSQSLAELIHLDDLEATLGETASVANGHVTTRFVNRMRHADGGYRWLSWTIVPDEGVMYVAVRDITSERTVMDELAATNRRLRDQIRERERVEAALQQMQRLEVVGQLTAGVAHDFNNLLTVILTSANFLTRDLEKGVFTKSPQRLENIRAAGERGAKLTSQLLSFSRRQRLEPVALNLNDTIGGMRELLGRALGGSVWVETDLAEDLWSALVDPTQTEMIILNLAINARDAMAQGGQLRLSTWNEMVYRLPQRPEDPDPGAYVVLSVSDTGCGMSEEVLAKAFEPFFTTKAVGKGSGLGLAQVFGFAKQSGGGVRIDTVEDVGTTIRVFLPSIAQTAQSVTSDSDMPGHADADDLHRTILLVDDDPAVRSVTAMMLVSLGYSVVEAENGEEALKKIDACVDLVLTDFAMPNMTGAELAARVRREHPDLPVMFITGFADIDILDVDQQLIVQKPYKEEELARKLANVLMKTGTSVAS
ncbi:response regulator [Pseudomonas sp. GD03842]|uniref:hybrid sensor histidine kinase/response regulator n=1 Tax=unclassified Pseudomonas TaxID=196821 RepID=UPI000D3423E6|nr:MULTISPECIES: hybrid sensor histidine kinase/response regulator [unclassified Pseudomonas]MDH0745637.1 response regulator [Pseudomonas sp. GD03842]RAU42147.1 response regulator [Pseudomonas sp. RIT 409]RAU49726.1 response regulator [Pseudomonas sp. RIT 412]